MGTKNQENGLWWRIRVNEKGWRGRKYCGGRREPNSGAVLAATTTNQSNRACVKTAEQSWPMALSSLATIERPVSLSFLHNKTVSTAEWTTHDELKELNSRIPCFLANPPSLPHSFPTITKFGSNTPFAHQRHRKGHPSSQIAPPPCPLSRPSPLFAHQHGDAHN